MNFQKDNLFIKVNDHSVSKETFELFRDENLDLLATFPVPNPENLSRYYESEDYISHTDGKRSLFEKAYHFVKNIALKNKTDLINKLQKDKGNLLDIGAGTGDFLATAKASGWQVTGTEPNEKAKSIAAQKGIALLENTANFESHSFDTITMWHVLEHIYDPEVQIRELKRLLKPEGTIIIAVPNFNSFDAKHYGEFWAAYDVPRHLWHFSKTAIRKLVENENLVLKQILPMKFDAFYVSLLSEKYKTGHMNFVKAAWIGMKSNLYAAKNMEYSSHIYVIENKQRLK
jgi:2-polyprenyl-3-methyl-5-hydroxy-6-metoxy-1,4-benzoquinol methylase